MPYFSFKISNRLRLSKFTLKNISSKNVTVAVPTLTPQATYQTNNIDYICSHPFQGSIAIESRILDTNTGKQLS